MAQTIIGVFNSFDRANAAVSILASKGLADIAQMHVSAGGLDDEREYPLDAGAPVIGSSNLERGTHEEHRGVVGSIEHFFSNLFGSEHRPDEAQHYQEAVRRGSALLAVDMRDDANLASVESELEKAGATDIDSRVAHWTSNGYTGYDDTAAPYAAEAIETERQSFPVIQEDLAVGKREVETGRFRVYSRPTERDVSESVNLHEEHASVERHAVDRVATEADFAPRTIEVRETEEVPVVAKTARVIEEVTIGKQASDRTETVNETLRGTEVVTEQVAGTDGARPDRNAPIVRE